MYSMTEVGGDRSSSKRGPATPKPVLPEKRLFARYRHVYAGKGGWLSTRTSMTPPVNYNSTNHYLDVYKKELILRLSKDIFESSRHPVTAKTTVCPNKASGHQASDTPERLATGHQASDTPEKQPTGHQASDSVTSGLSHTIQAQNDVTHSTQPVNDVTQVSGVSMKPRINSPHTEEFGINEKNAVKALETPPSESRGGSPSSQEDPVNNTANEKDNCFITSLQRAHTIIGTIHPADNNGNGNQISEAELCKQAGSEGPVEKPLISECSQSSVQPGVVDVLREQTSDTAKRPSRKHTELELRVLRQRSFVKASRMAGGGDGTLSRSGRHLVTRMSQEALLAISETRREMAQVSAPSPASPTQIAHRSTAAAAANNFCLGGTGDQSGAINDVRNDLVFSPTSKKHSSTEATPISPDLRLMSVMNKQRKQDSIRYSFNMSRVHGAPTKKRFSKSGTSLGVHEPQCVNHLSPPSKLPYLNSRSTEELRPEHLGSSPAYKKEQPAAHTLHTLNQFKRLTKEKSFQITPPGWDVRYKDMYGKKLQEALDETPEDVKDRAIEKCSDWLTKYM